MSIKLSTRNLILALLFAITATFLLGLYLGVTKDKKALNASLLASELKIERLTLELDNQLTYVVRVEQDLATQKELVKAGIVERETLKKLNIKQLNELTKAQLRIDTLLEDVVHNGQVITIHDTITINKEQNCILLPFSFTKKDQWLDLKGDFNSQAKLDISLSMQADVNVYTGVEKKTKEPFCQVMSTNPYIQIINVASYKTDVPKPKRYGIGFQAGYGVTKDGSLSPYIGGGLSYNVIRF